MTPAYLLPLCTCADRGAFCEGRKEGFACMAKDKWYETPCRKGECPGLMSKLCCGISPFPLSEDEEE